MANILALLCCLGASVQVSFGQTGDSYNLVKSCGTNHNNYTYCITVSNCSHGWLSFRSICDCGNS